MAPKRSRPEGSSKGTSSSSQGKFVSEKSKESFEISKLTRKLIPERGFDISNEQSAALFEMIVNRKWEELCAQPRKAAVSLVREFYANALEGKDYKVTVRGKQVLYDHVTINRLFKLPDLPQDEFTALEENYDLDLIIKTLCDIEANWKISKGEKISFPSTCLRPDVALWYLFVAARLLPVTHTSDVTRERAIMLFAIHQGIYLNIERMMSRAIASNINATNVSFYFPSLITALCIKASCDLDPDEEWLQPTQPINFTVIKRILKNKGARTGGSTSAAPSVHSRPISHLSTNERMALLESRQKRLEERQEDLQEWAEYQTAFNVYQAGSNQTINSLLRGIATHLQIDTSQVPPLPSCPEPYKFPEYSSYDEEEEDDA